MTAMALFECACCCQFSRNGNVGSLSNLPGYDCKPYPLRAFVLDDTSDNRKEARKLTEGNVTMGYGVCKENNDGVREPHQAGVPDGL